jgi:restriction-modification enzyme MmeI-like protein
LNIAQIEENVKTLLLDLASGECKQDAFIYELLLAYGHRKQSITRLRSGERNMASKSNEPYHDEIIWKRHLYYKQVEGSSLHAEIDQMCKEKLVTTNKTRFVIVTNFDQLLAVDTKTSDSLDINLDDLPKQFDFFLPWANMEKAVYKGENPADVKAAEKMAKLFDLIKGDNFDESNRDDTEALHNLNVFLTRLLFCFFAEDTEIFADNQFSLAIQSHTKEDGSGLSDYLNRLFTVLNTTENGREGLPDYLSNFPYVNGGLFADDIPSPAFSAKSRRMLIECGGELNWSDINPDIFGSMIQAVVHPDQRGGMGMHYTSVTNIMKVIEPLFLNDLYEELEKIESSATKLQKLQQRLSEIKIFDPACGSGNFLIIAYKELRKLEMEVLKRLQELELEKTGQVSQPFSVIKLSQFYGIELDDFAHEVAILSLWLAEHQMNVEFKAEFGEAAPNLPLKNSGKIIQGNALRIDWAAVCEPSGEVYAISNPPYAGASQQGELQKEEIKALCEGRKVTKNLNYVGCWFLIASKYIENSTAKVAFVSTDSITQGSQVEMLWPYIFERGVFIQFAHTSFWWKNNAKAKARIMCVIIGLSSCDSPRRILYSDHLSTEVKNINSYLLSGESLIVKSRSKQISGFSKLVRGSIPTDGGGLLLSPEEKQELLTEDPRASKYVKRYVGSNEFIHGVERYCLWIEDEEVEEAKCIPFIQSRLDTVAAMRLKSTKKNTNLLASTPHKFEHAIGYGKPSLMVPRISGLRRKYIPLGFMGSDVVVNDGALAVFDAKPRDFSVLSSLMHACWAKTLAGRPDSTDSGSMRYSSSICYNTFPFPEITEAQGEELDRNALNILKARESHPDKTIAQMYDPKYMPEDLLNAHLKNDLYIESLYSSTRFETNHQRLEYLFDLYSKMIHREAANKSTT